jgi:putative ABC transport system permease protein
VTTGIGKVPGVAAVGGFRFAEFDYGGSKKQAVFMDHTTANRIVNIGLRSGSWSDLGLDKVFVYKDPAQEHHFHVGSKFTATFGSGARRVLTVAGIYDEAGLVRANWLLDVSTFDQNFTGTPFDQFAGASVAPGQPVEAVKSRVNDFLAKTDPAITAQDRKEFQKSQEDQINRFLAVISALLFLAVVIALIGIANTLALSVFERTRELGLMRAVGMQRSQTKSMVRWESVLVAVFGALLGIALGIVLGSLVANALPATFVSSIAIPIPQLVEYVVLAIIAGTISAYFPARRAAKMNVLDAISHE